MSEHLITKHMICILSDCTGGTQAGVKWLKRLHSDLASQDTEIAMQQPKGSLAWDNLRLNYNVNARLKTFRFYIPPDLRERLCLPVSYERAGLLYVFLPYPGIEKKYFLINRLEGHRSASTLTDAIISHIRIKFSLTVEIACGGWGDAPSPSKVSDLREYFYTVNAAEGMPDWIHKLVEQLLEIPEHTTVEPVKTRK